PALRPPGRLRPALGSDAGGAACVGRPRRGPVRGARRLGGDRQHRPIRGRARRAARGVRGARVDGEGARPPILPPPEALAQVPPPGPAALTPPPPGLTASRPP